MRWISSSAERTRFGAACRHLVRATAWLVLVGVPSGGIAAQEREEREERESVRRREEDRRLRKSLGPDGTGSEGVFQAKRFLGTDATVRIHGGWLENTAPDAWRPIGPQGFNGVDGYFASGAMPDEGRVIAVTPHPTDPNTIYAGSASGGIWRSTNLGDSWTPLSDTQCSLSVTSIVVDSINPGILYAATGEPNTANLGCGLLRSTDGGASWTNTGPAMLQGGWVGRVALDRSTRGAVAGAILLMASTSGILRSADGGTTWTTVRSGMHVDVIQHPANANIWYASTLSSASGRDVLRSTDRGLTWTPLGAGTGLGATAADRIELAVSPARPGSVWAIFSDGTNSRTSHIGRWDEATATWTALNVAATYTGDVRGDMGTQSWYNMVIAVDPTDANVIYVGGVRPFRSRDGGATFSPIASSVHVDWHTISVDPRDPRILWAGCDGGVFLSTDGGTTWRSRNTNLSISQFYQGISLHPTLPFVALGGTQDNGTLQWTGSPMWVGRFGGDGGPTAINPQNPNIQWYTTQWSSTAAAPSIRRHDLQAGSNVNRGAGIAVAGERSAFIPILRMDPVNPNKLYYTTQRVWRTANEGVAWASISPDLTGGSGHISTLAISPADTQTVWAGTSDGRVQVTADGGITWTNVSGGLPAAFVSDVAADPTNPQRAIVTFSGAAPTRVWLTEDRGTTWTAIGASLPNVPVNAAVFVTANRVFVGTDVGTYEGTGPAFSFTAAVNGLPRVEVTDLAYNATTGRLVAATYGRGMWEYTVAAAGAVLRGDTNANGSVTAADALLVVQYVLGTGVGTLAQADLNRFFARADANCNGRLELLDAIIILRHAVGTPTAGACVGTTQ